VGSGGDRYQNEHEPMIQTRRRAAELRDEALFKDPPAKEDCPICFLPMPYQLISCMTLPPATFTSVPIYDYALAISIYQIWIWSTIIHAEERAFVMGACSPFASL
jgi:hypothetical protein